MKPTDIVGASKEEQTSFQKSKYVFRSETEATAFELQALNPKAHFTLPSVVGLITRGHLSAQTLLSLLQVSSFGTAMRI